MQKSDIIIPSFAAHIHIGDSVVFKDGSYTLSILRDNYILEQTSLGLSNDIWIVVAVNVTIPTRNSITDSLNPSNNCIVKNEKGDIAFCSYINISNIRELGDDKPYTLRETSPLNHNS